MNITEALNSDDKEIVDLYASLYYKEFGREALIKIITPSKKWVFSHIHRNWETKKDKIYIGRPVIFNYEP